MELSAEPYFALQPDAPLPMGGGSAALRAALGNGSTLQRRLGYVPVWLDELSQGTPSLVTAAAALAANVSIGAGAFG
eukprot:1871325-Prymnesium_polylepis.1